MKRKYWWIFGVVQATGAVALVESSYLGAISSFFILVPTLLLLPGSLAWVPMAGAEFFGIGISFILWSNAVAVAANVLLFAIISLVVTRFPRHRKPS
jgi:hypothetical protein